MGLRGTIGPGVFGTGGHSLSSLICGLQTPLRPFKQETTPANLAGLSNDRNATPATIYRT
jgi:hypothetical protein